MLGKPENCFRIVKLLRTLQRHKIQKQKHLLKSDYRASYVITQVLELLPVPKHLNYASS